MFDKNNRS